MAVFAIVSLRTSPTAHIEAALQAHYAERFIEVDEGHWLLNDPNGTAETVSKKIGLINPPDPVNHSIAVVYNVGGYFGRAPNRIWEWLSTNFGVRL